MTQAQKMHPPPETAQPQPAPKRHGLRSWLLGILLLAALILFVTNFGEIEHFAQLARQARPAWLLAALLLQTATYFCAAAVWQQTLHYAGVPYSLVRLVPLGVAKLFSDQALPSGGMSGTAFFVTALHHRGVPAELCMAAVIVNLVTFYAAFVLVVLASIALLWFHHAIQAWIVGAILIFSVVAVAIPAGALWLQRFGQREPPAFLLRVPDLGNLLQTFGAAPGHLLRTPSLIVSATALQTAIFLLDAATLWAMLRAVGLHVSFLVAFPALAIAAMVATIGLIPLGLGTFEASCVAILNLLGTPVEAALTATLLLRGFTLWLPMLPGLWFARSEPPPEQWT